MTPFSVSSVPLTITMNRIAALPLVSGTGAGPSGRLGPALLTRRTSLARIDTAAQDSFRSFPADLAHVDGPAMTGRGQGWRGRASAPPADRRGTRRAGSVERQTDATQ